MGWLLTRQIMQMFGDVHKWELSTMLCLSCIAKFVSENTALSSCRYNMASGDPKLTDLQVGEVTSSLAHQENQLNQNKISKNLIVTELFNIDDMILKSVVNV